MALLWLIMRYIDVVNVAARAGTKDRNKVSAQFFLQRLLQVIRVIGSVFSPTDRVQVQSEHGQSSKRFVFLTLAQQKKSHVRVNWACGSHNIRVQFARIE